AKGAERVRARDTADRDSGDEHTLDVSYRYNVAPAVLVENFDEQRAGAEVHRAARVASDVHGRRAGDERDRTAAERNRTDCRFAPGQHRHSLPLSTNIEGCARTRPVVRPAVWWFGEP